MAFRRQDDIVRSMDFDTRISSTHPRHCYILHYHLHHNKRGKSGNQNLIHPTYFSLYKPCNDLSYQYSLWTLILFTVSWKYQVWGCSAVIFEEGSKSFSACSCNECWILDVLDSVWNIMFHSRLHFTNVIIWNFLQKLRYYSCRVTVFNYERLSTNILRKSIFINNHLQPHRTNAINAPYNDGKDDSSYQSCLVYRIEFAGK